MASEDSENLDSFDQPALLLEPAPPSSGARLAARVESPRQALEARALHRPQWMRLEERHHSLGQLRDSSDAELHSITVVDGDLTAVDEPAKLLEEDDIPLMLYHAELWKDLPADLHRGLPIHADVETTFAVDQTDHPFGTQAFLLITCTERIVTHH